MSNKFAPITAKEHQKLVKKDFKNGVLGYAADMTEEEVAGKVIDSVSGLVFEDKQSYLNHVSPVTGHRADSIDHLPKIALKISENALKRGAEKSKK